MTKKMNKDLELKIKFESIENMTFSTIKSEFIKTIESYTYKFRTWEIFADFCQLGALAYRQFAYYTEEQEEQYLKLINSYEEMERINFKYLFKLFEKAMELKFSDFLGDCFMSLDLGSKYKGQFFTPYSISSMMAQMLGTNSNDTEKFSEPACGAGGMIIARAEALAIKGIDYKSVLEVQAVDVDPLCVNMCYMQLTALGIVAEVVHGNTLSLEVWNVYHSPNYIIKNIRRVEREKALKRIELMKSFISGNESKINPKDDENKKPYEPNFILLEDEIQDKLFKTNTKIKYSQGSLF